MDNFLNITAVGDICPGDKAILGTGVGHLALKNGTEFFFTEVKNTLKNADVVVGNLEGLLTDDVNNVKTKIFCGPKEMASALKNCGFSIISVANNHIFEYGEQLFAETVRILSDAGINVCGLRGTDEFYSKPVILNLHGKRVGFLAYNWVGKDKFKGADKYVAQVHDSVVNYTWDRNTKQPALQSANRNVIRDIILLKKDVDIIVLLPHWGYEFIHSPPYGVVNEAKTFIDAGADLILGSHPHVLQGYEKYKDKWVFYSLGNFVFDMRLKDSKKSAILKYTLNFNGEDTFQIIDCYINNTFQPCISKANKSKIIMDDSAMTIASSNIQVLLNDDILYKKFEKKYLELKITNIYNHFIELFRHPAVIRVILIKVFNFGKILFLNVIGKRVRW